MKNFWKKSKSSSLCKRKTGCKILLAQKCFSMFSVYPLIGKYLDGTTASGLFEAKLGHEEMKKKIMFIVLPIVMMKLKRL